MGQTEKALYVLFDSGAIDGGALSALKIARNLSSPLKGSDGPEAGPW